MSFANPHERFLGDLDAENDDNFYEHFIESDIIRKIHNAKSDIIYGSKGMGKTSLRRALAEMMKDSYQATMVINLDNLSFEAIHSELSTLNQTTNHEISKLARNIWQNILLEYGFETLMESLEKDDPLRHKIFQALSAEGFMGDESDGESGMKVDIYFRLINQIEIFFNKFQEITFAYKSKTTHHTGTTKSLGNLVDKFPLNDKFNELLKECKETKGNERKNILICLDGFDSIVSHTPESRKAIFSGLIDAIFKLRNNKEISSIFSFKAFLPEELTLDASATVWDADKHFFNIHYIRWREEDFKVFIEKRLSKYSRKKSQKFVDVWYEFMPEKLDNNRHSMEENTFEYILRHTLYRPRQILIHLQNILTQWDNKTDSFKVAPSFIPKIVAETNYIMAENVANQLSIVYPNIVSFLKSWQNSSNVILAKEFQDRIKIHFPNLGNNEAYNRLFDELFSFGVFGIMASINGSNSAQRRTPFKFAFVGNTSTSHIHTSIKPDDHLALAPMFNEYCGCSPSSHGVIVPISVN